MNRSGLFLKIYFIEKIGINLMDCLHSRPLNLYIKMVTRSSSIRWLMSLLHKVSHLGFNFANIYKGKSTQWGWT